MQDYPTFMEIFTEGRVLQARKLILRFFAKRCGPPPEWAIPYVEAISDLDRLERISERLLDAHGWADLLNTG